RRQAVDAIRDQKVLAGVARHASEAGPRMLAIGRVSDAAELEGVALRGDHADAAVAAIDQLVEPSVEVLTGISQKARTKAAQKRARAMLRAVEPPAAAETGPTVEYKDV